jgi:hypothetical protein
MALQPLCKQLLLEIGKIANSKHLYAIDKNGKTWDVRKENPFMVWLLMSSKAFMTPKQEHGIKEPSLKMVFSKIIQSIHKFFNTYDDTKVTILLVVQTLFIGLDWILIKNEHSRNCNHPKQRKIETKGI